MGIFDKLKNVANDAVNAVSNATSNTKETFTFAALPESLAQLQALPEASLDSPFKTAALSVCALCAYGADKQIGIEMLNWLRGPRPLSNQEISFLDDRFRDGKFYIPFSYFAGATPDNDYTPSSPFTITIETNPYSDANEGYKKLFIKSGGADGAREIVLRMKGDGKWFLWDQFLMVGIRDPKSSDPWA
ncbi:MAG: hypothetical protein E7490_05905 [Ruminococcaceae bacterium]|nr:hypothetical protein [Oscillospiraceae bacterium]